MAQKPEAPDLQQKALLVVLDEDRCLDLKRLCKWYRVGINQTVPQPTSVTDRSRPIKVSESSTEHVLLVHKADNILDSTEQYSNVLIRPDGSIEETDLREEANTSPEDRRQNDGGPTTINYN